MSQGEWSIGLWGEKDGKKVFAGTTSNVTIKWNFYEPNVTVPVPVNENTGDKGFIVLTDVKIKVGESIITPNYAAIDGIAITNLNGAYMKIECAPGTHSVTFAYKDGSIGYAEETITVEVKSGLETKVIGFIDGSGSSGSSESQTTVMQPIQGGVKATEEVKVESSIVPLTTSSPETKTTVTFEAGSFTKDSTDAVLNLSVKSVGSEFSVTSTGSSTPVAGINISLFVNGNEVKEFNGKEVVIETYIAKDLTDVKVRYIAENTTEDFDISNSNNDPGTSATIPDGYKGIYYKDTGKLIFKTPHFSEYYVLADEVEAYNTNQNKVYATLAGAINNSNEGETVSLLKDVTLSGDLILGSGLRGVNINLNGKTINGGSYQVHIECSGVTTIFGDGIITNTNNTQSADFAPLRIYAGSNVVLDGVKVPGNYCGVKNSGNLTIRKATIEGTTFGLGCFGGSTTNIGVSGGNDSDVTITAKEQALATAADTGLSDMIVNVYCGTFTTTGTEWDDCPAYWASHGTLNVYGGTYTNRTSSTGAAGILQKNGTVNIHGGSFQAKDGIKIVAQSDSTEIITDISGGSFTGTRSGIYIDASNATYMGQLTSYSVCINDNDSSPIFKGDSDGAIYTKTGGLGSRTLMTISGGQFLGEDPSAYVINGYGCRLTSNGYYEVVTARDAGYKIGTALPVVGPIVSGNVWTVNPSNAQYTLDGAYGSIDGKTIVFSEGSYPQMELGRATKYAGSNTEYYIGGISEENNKSFDEFCTIKNSGTWSASAYYVRNINNVKLKAESGVIMPSIVASSGHVYGQVYDYVLDKAYTSGSAYYLVQNINNVTIEGFNFTENVDFDSSLSETVIDGVKFSNCTFTTGGTASSNKAGLRYYNENNNGKVRNLTVDGCTFNNCYQGVYTQNINGITVKNSTFDTTGHNAIAVQSGSGAVNHKEVVITGNTFNKIGDRIIRFGNVGADTQITIQNNTATDSGDSKGEVMKAQSLAAGVTYNISGNNWGEGKNVANTELIDQ